MKGLISAVRGQFTAEQQVQLEGVIRRHYQANVSDATLRLFWMEFEPDQMFTNYQPSQSTIVTLECENDFPQQQRVALLTRCAKDWCEITGQDPDHLMLALVEKSLFAEMLASNRERLSALGAVQFYGQAIKRAVQAKLSRGIFAFSANV